MRKIHLIPPAARGMMSPLLIWLLPYGIFHFVIFVFLEGLTPLFYERVMHARAFGGITLVGLLALVNLGFLTFTAFGLIGELGVKPVDRGHLGAHVGALFLLLCMQYLIHQQDSYVENWRSYPAFQDYNENIDSYVDPETADGWYKRGKYWVDCIERAYNHFGWSISDKYYFATLKDLTSRWEQKSMEALEKALKLDPGHEESLLLKITLFEIKKDYEQALKVCAEYIKKYPDDYRGYLRRLRICNKKDILRDEFRDDIKNAKRCGPEVPQVYIEDGIFLCQLGIPKMGRKVFNQAAELDPTSPEPYLAFVETFIYDETKDEDLENLQMAMKIDPEYPRTLYLFGEFYLDHGNRAKALEYFRKTVNSPSEKKAYYKKRAQNKIDDLEKDE